ncbi:MAG TPA: PaaI family thioesterase [Acidimicrobiia bacterium]|nr:PaaI family thioesterase [Acidimicrobiia bacterium]
MPEFPRDLAQLKKWFEEHGEPRLPGLLGIEVVTIEPGQCTLRFDIGVKHLASNGYLHAASVIALADTAAGYGCVASLPEGAVGFTTVELKSNHTANVTSGGLVAHASMQHGGRTIQVWDAVVRSEEEDRQVCLFRNTQLILYR